MKYLILLFVFCVSFLDGFGQEVQDSLVYPHMDTLTILQSHFDTVAVEAEDSIFYIIDSNAISFRDQYLFLALLILAFLGVLLHHNSRQEISQIVEGLFNVNFSIQVARWSQKGNKLFLWAYLLLFFYALILGVWIGLEQVMSLSIFLPYVGLILAAFITLEYSSYKLVGFLAEQDDVAHAVRFNVHQLAIFGFWGVLFFLFFILYAPSYLQFWLGVVFLVSLVLLFVYKEIRIIQVLLSERIKLNLFYFFLYICTFKILPVAVVAKLLLTNAL